MNTSCKAEHTLTSQIRTQSSRSYLTGAIKSCTKNSKRLHYSFAVITFYSIEGGYPRKGFMPSHVLLHNIPKVSNIEGIFIILEQIHILKLQTIDNRISLEVSIWVGACLAENLQSQLVPLFYKSVASWNAVILLPYLRKMTLHLFFGQGYPWQ